MRKRLVNMENRRWRAIASGLWHDLARLDRELAERWLASCPDLKREVGR